MRKSMILGALVAAFVSLPATTAGATRPLDVQFEVLTTIPGDGGPTFGPFVASGPAVDDGVMCPSGSTIDVFGKPSALPSPTGINFQVVKQFSCDDGSGDFFVKLQVRIDRKGDNFRWVVLGGTGSYERLHGVGDGVGLPLDEVTVLDLYDGALHVD